VVAFQWNSGPHILGIPGGDILHSILNKWQLTFFFLSLWVVLSCFHKSGAGRELAGGITPF